MTFRILVVCTANVCRSPLAAALLTENLLTENGPGPTPGIAISGAGVGAVVGAPACREMRRTAATQGLPMTRLHHHRARQLTVGGVTAADLVLASDRQVRSAILRMAPDVAPRVFTLREAAALAEAADDGLGTPGVRSLRGIDAEHRLRDLVAAMHASRGLIELPRTRRLLALPVTLRPLAVHDHDVPDAHQRDLAPHRVVFRLTADAAHRLGWVLSATASAPATAR
jgi:protein-tyrosine phosphatase